MTDRILIAEDDQAIADSVAYSLRACGYHVDAVASGEAVLEFAPATYALLILDVRLPGLSGVETCRRVRERGPVPVLMLTALDGEVDRVIGLEAGADDYLGKPFSMAELVSRVRAILRRRELDREPDSIRQDGGLTLDLGGQTALIDGRSIELTPAEFRILALLAAEPGRVFTRAEIARRLARGSAPSDERWAFAQGAYLDCPLPSLFKERLFVHLSRFCEVRYCVIRHACFLAGLGLPAGDPSAPAQSVAEITALLRRPVPEPSALITVIDRLEASLVADAPPGSPPDPLPWPGTERESDLFDALTVIFLDARQAVRARAVVAAVAGDPATEQLMGLLAFIRAAHHWTEMHPDLPLEPDAIAFLREHQELARLLTSTADALAVNPQTAWQAAAAELAAKREAQQRAQREFVANAAHELRTPLTAVIAVIDTLDRGAIYDAAGRDRFFAHIRREAARLSRLCDSLLMLAEAQAGSRMPTSAVVLRAMLEDVAGRLRTATGVKVIVDAPAGLTIHTNAGLLERILTNLGENAAKYTAGGQIVLRAAATGGGVTVEIQDTGQGLGLSPAEAVERFSRGGARGADGFGLGLSIAHQAAIALNGTLILRDNAGAGTLATLTLPQDPPVSARVLVIDDEEAIRDSIAYTLQAAGYRVTAAATGHDALASTMRQRFDLIIADMLLPDMHGTDLIAAIRRDHADGARILAITARTGAADLALSAGADQFLAKPFAMDRLLAQTRALTSEQARVTPS